MLACKAILWSLLVLSVGVACCGCTAGSGPRWFGARVTRTAQRRSPPEPAPPLRIAEPPGFGPAPQIAKLLPPVAAPEDESLSTPPLVARGPVPDDALPTPAGDLRSLHRQAAERYAQLEAYTVRLRRHEQGEGGERREEILMCKFRKEPRAVYVKWVGDEGKDRELISVAGRNGTVVHLLTAAGDIPLAPRAGKHVKLAPDSAVLKSLGRHTLADPGLGVLIDRFGAALEAAQRGEPGAGPLTYQGVLWRSEFDKPLEAVLQVVPAGAEPELPGGGERLWFFDPELRLPVLVVTHDPHGEELGYCCYEQLTFPGQLPDDAFDPEILWHTR